MGAWGELAFDNDTANDWANDLVAAHDLSSVESTFAEVGAVGAGYLDQDVACCALAACEVVARLQGHPGYTKASTAIVDRWVADHPLTVTGALVARAQASIDRILGDDSELRQLWEEQDPGPWLASVADLRMRVA